MSATTFEIENLHLHYKVRKIHSLFGIIPVGLFLIEHLSVNSLASTRGGEQVFNAAVNVLHGVPYLLFVEMVFIFIPLLVHAVYGIVITAGGGLNLESYNLWRNWLYVLQRVSGVITLIFVGFHVYWLRVASMINPEFHITFQTMSQHLASPFMFWFYVIGLGAAVFHFANGIWNFCITWGITVGPKSQRTNGWVCAAIGIMMFGAGLNALLAFTSCAR